ncbi:MAG: hypothetical protein PSV23_10270 [Brevundimonas sp.]|uniref:hypothetical protein n=1 Tax=Brevundimonas sp. TaxID=1871086 RepID=UPI0024882CBF|nr:hypothetical protein [Brevundimonas sp.]MDI1327169.1 hypothetical protein [Brevundimonas sp.]
MRSGMMRRGLSLAALCAAAVLAGCASGQAEAEAEAARVAEAAALAARTPPPITLSQGVAQDAAVYLAFARDIATIRGGFESPEAIQAALRQGAAYDPGQISRGLVAYASIVALQSPAFVTGVNQYGINPTGRQKMIADIVADPRVASYMPGADEAAGLIMAALNTEIDALSTAANSVENDAYAAQADGRRSWAIAHIADRETRLAGAKTLSGQTMLPPAAESARLFAAAGNGAGLGVTGGRRREGRPYPPVVTNALALAALAALGAAGEDARANTAALQSEPTSQTCLHESKLNLYQCLAASRPSYEDMFCLGRHIVRDLATCTRSSALPAATVTVSDPVAADPLPPVIVTVPIDPPLRTQASPTERLNMGTAAPIPVIPGG